MKYDFNQQTITLTVSQTFAKKAGKYNSLEYNLIKRLRADHPTMEIVVCEKQKSSRARLTFKQMEDFIQEVEEDALPLFEKVKKVSKVQRSPYNYVRAWFENRYPHYTEMVVFDDDGNMTFGKQEEETQREEKQKQSLIDQIQSKLTTIDEEAA